MPICTATPPTPSSAVLNDVVMAGSIGPIASGPLSADEHGNRRAGQHAGCLAAQQEFGKPASSVGAHHDEIARRCFRVLDDAFGGIAIGDVHGLACYIVAACALSGAGVFRLAISRP